MDVKPNLHLESVPCARAVWERRGRDKVYQSTNGSVADGRHPDKVLPHRGMVSDAELLFNIARAARTSRKVFGRQGRRLELAPRNVCRRCRLSPKGEANGGDSVGKRSGGRACVGARGWRAVELRTRHLVRTASRSWSYPAFRTRHHATHVLPHTEFRPRPGAPGARVGCSRSGCRARAPASSERARWGHRGPGTADDGTTHRRYSETSASVATPK